MPISTLAVASSRSVPVQRPLRKLGFGLGLVTLLLSLAPGAASATLSSTQQVCQQREARVARDLFRDVSKALRACRNRIASGALPPATDCTLESRTASKIARVSGKVATRLAAKCDDATVQSLVFGAGCTGSSTVAELASCLIQTHKTQALALADAVYDGGSAVSGTRRACLRFISKQTSRLASLRLDVLQACKNNISSGDLPAGTDCPTEAAVSLADAEARTVGRIADRCSDSVIAALPFGSPCTGATTASSLAACVAGSHRQRVEKLLVVEYGAGTSGGTAVARHITNPAADCVKGPSSRCRADDYLLANDKIRVVVQDVQRNLYGIGQFGGQIIDADLVRAPLDPDRDNFEEWATSINIENTAHYTNLTIVNDGSDGQAAILRATGVDDLLDFLNPSSTVAGFGFPFPVSANDVDLPIEISTDYILEPGANWVRVETTLQNTSGAAFKIFFGEFINGSGQVNLFQPAYGIGEPLVTTPCPVAAANACNFLAYGGYGNATGVSYGYVHDIPGSTTFSTSGVTVPLLGTEVVLALIGAALPPHELKALGDPADHRTFTRYFVVGDGSISSIADARNEIQCRGAGNIEGNVTLGGNPVAGARISVYGSTAQGPGGLLRNVVTQGVTDAAGNYSVSVAPGTYDVVASVDGAPYEGGGSSPATHNVSVTAFQSATANVAIPATGALHVTVTDGLGAPIPAKVSVVGLDPSPDPANTQSIFGLINNRTGVFDELSKDGRPFGVTRVMFLDQTGDSGVVSVEPGNYRVYVSRGGEWSVAQQSVVVTAGATTNVSAEIARVIDSTGFVSGDFHVHSIDSPDSQITRRDRLVSMLAEGIDFFTPSDHDFRSNFQPDLDALGANALISVATSGEITTFDYGHFNAWPMTIDPSKVNGGSVDFCGAAPAGLDFPSHGNYCLTPAQIIAAAQADPGTNTVQINHIGSHFGIETGFGLAIDTGVVPPQSGVSGVARRLDPMVPNYFSSAFNALEIWIGDDRDQVFASFLGTNAGDWFNLLNQGIVRTGVADSDTHRRLLTQAGTPHNMVASPTDNPSGLDAIADTLSANVNAGRVVGTNSPMVRVTTFAASTGETGSLELGFPTTIATTDNQVQVQIDVQSPAWAEFDRIELYVNSTTTRTSSNKESGAGVVNVKRYAITPDMVLNKGVDFAVSTVNVDPMVPGADRLETSVTVPLVLSEDSWIVVMVKGTDGVSRPLFPMVPNSLKTSTNTNLAQLTDGNLGEDGMLALAFTNPLFVDVDGGGWTAPGLSIVP